MKTHVFKAGWLVALALAGGMTAQAQTKVQKPVILPLTGVYTGSVEVTISCATPDAVIHYTLDATIPTATSPVYKGPFVVTKSGYVVAKAFKKGMEASPYAYVQYRILPLPRVATPVIKPVSGVYSGSVAVTVSCATPGAAIRYTLNGTEPNADTSSLYEGPVTLSSNAIFRARGYKDGMQPSLVSSANYSIYKFRCAPPLFSPTHYASYAGSVTVTITCATAGAGIRYAFVTNEVDAPVYQDYEGPVVLEQTGKLMAQTFKEGLNPGMGSATYYVFPPRVATPVANPLPGVYSNSVTVTLACETEEAVIRYTLDGTEPDETSELYTGDPIVLTESTRLYAKGFKTDYQASFLGGGMYKVVVPQVAAPVFSPPGGSYIGSVTVSVSCETPDAELYVAVVTNEEEAVYEPYTGPLTLTQSSRLLAKGVRAGFADGVASAFYTVGLERAATPVLTPGGGAYASSVTVAMASSTPDAVIRYTLNGADPNPTNSEVYGGPVVITKTTPVKARAFKDGYAASLPASGVYTIYIPPVKRPFFTPAPGTYTSSVTVAISCDSPGATLSYALSSNSIVLPFVPYTEPITLTRSTKIVAKATGPGMGEAIASGFYFIITPRVATPVIMPLANLTYTGSVTVAITCATPGASIRYTLNGAEPTAVNSLPYAAPFTLTTSTLVRARAFKENCFDSPMASRTYKVVSVPVAPPVFEPADGVYDEGMSVILTCPTPGAEILYTLDGSDPDAFSPIYGDPIILNAPATIKAKAIRLYWTDSGVVTQSYE